MASETCRECYAEVRCGECGAEEPGYRPPAVPDPTVEALSERTWAEAFLREWSKPYFGPDAADAVACVMRAARAVVVEPDNHHNAALCPYCTPARAAAHDALRVAVEALAAEWERRHNEQHRGQGGWPDLAECPDCADVRRLRALLDDPALAGRATGGEG